MLFIACSNYAQEQNKNKRRYQRLVMSEFSEAYTTFTINAFTTSNDLLELEQKAKDYGATISFKNAKYDRNQLVYLELNYYTNDIWQTLSFGSDKVKLLPVNMKLTKVYNTNPKQSFLTITNNKNNTTGNEPFKIAFL